MINLDFSNERYVRAYVRDTEEYLCLPWQAQGLYWAIRRKADRAGIIMTRKGAVGVALLIRWPIDIVDEFLPHLVDAGFVESDERGFFLPDFMCSEEAKQSEAHRSREYRARRKEVGAPKNPGGFVYVVRAGSGEVKIGFAVDVGAQLQRLRTARPDGVTLVAAWAALRDDEIAAHQRFAHVRRVGEWFDPAADLLAWALSMQSVENEHDMYLSSGEMVSGDRKQQLIDHKSDVSEREETVPPHNVTARQVIGSKPSLLPVPPNPTSEEERRKRYSVANRVFVFMEAERRKIDRNARATAQIHCEDMIVRLLGMGHTEDDLLHVVRVAASEARQNPSDPLRWFQAATIWKPDQVERLKNRRLPETDTADRGDGLRAGGSKPVRAPDADEHAKRRIAELDAEAAARARGAR